jgi:hypothetical protein
MARDTTQDCDHAGEWQWLPQDSAGQWRCMACGAALGQTLPPPPGARTRARAEKGDDE